jgi:uncharacterized protein YsxB (DUF464 family)
MIKIVFFKKGNHLIGYEIEGHSEYADFGSDIVCASVSSMAQMAIVELNLIKAKVNVKKDEKKSYLICKLSDKTSENEKLAAQNVFNALKISLEDVQKDFKKFIKLEVKDEIN